MFFFVFQSELDSLRKELKFLQDFYNQHKNCPSHQKHLNKDGFGNLCDSSDCRDNCQESSDETFSEELRPILQKEIPSVSANTQIPTTNEAKIDFDTISRTLWLRNREPAKKLLQSLMNSDKIKIDEFGVVKIFCGE